MILIPKDFTIKENTSKQNYIKKICEILTRAKTMEIDTANHGLISSFYVYSSCYLRREGFIYSIDNPLRMSFSLFLYCIASSFFLYFLDHFNHLELAQNFQTFYVAKNYLDL